jgi:hypothetical protein
MREQEEEVEEETETEAPNVDKGGRHEAKTMEIVEFLCPGGYISHEQDALERPYEERKQKDTELTKGMRIVPGEEDK